MAENLMPEQPQMPTPENGVETVEKQEGKQIEQGAIEKEVSQKQKKSANTVAQPTVTIPSSMPLPPQESQKSETLEKIEDIMEEDLAEMYATMPEDRKQLFKKQGEETAKEIEGMMYKVKVKSKKMFKLMFSWMKIIPGVSKYFLEQEAKLKTDELMHLKEEIDRQRENQL